MSESNGTPDWSRKEVFSTGEAARICNISQQTIIRCFDSGFLQGFRVPGSRFRRIPRDELIRFMKAHDIPVDLLERSAWRLLLLDGGRQSARTVQRMLGDDEAYELKVATNGYDAGVMTERYRPHVLIVAGSAGVHWRVVVSSVRANRELREMKLLVILGADEPDDGAAVEADEVLRRPLREDDLRQCLESLLPVPAIAGA
ncbi:MAG: helix-turn-helix domain-containing protein [Planctomycetota bacterium]